MISIVIPSYNEELAIADTITRCKTVLDNAGLSPFEVIVVDDGSADNTVALAEQAGAKVIPHLVNMGYGYSLKTGIRAAQYATIIIVDADSTYPIETIPELHKEYTKGYNMVVGARQGKHYSQSFMKSSLRLFLKWLVQYVTGTRIPDINSGLRIFSKTEASPHFSMLSNAFSFTTSITLVYLLTGLSIKYVPISYHKRDGKTKVKLVRDILRTLQYILEIILYYNPLKIYLLLVVFCLILGSLFLGLGLGFAWPVFTGLGVIMLATLPVLVAFTFLSSQLKQIEKRKHE